MAKYLKYEKTIEDKHCIHIIAATNDGTITNHIYAAIPRYDEMKIFVYKSYEGNIKELPSYNEITEDEYFGLYKKFLDMDYRPKYLWY